MCCARAVVVVVLVLVPGALCAMPDAGHDNSSVAHTQQPSTHTLKLEKDQGRGVDQILPYHCHPRIYESCVHNARDYVALALEANGPLPEGPPVSPAYPWGVALADLAVRRPDAMIINLETAVTVHDVPWPCKPINYRMHPGNVLTLTAVSASVPTVASLANNHTLDWGLPGLEETLHVLASAGIRTAGAGRDADEARRPAVVPVVHEPAQPAAGPAAAPESAAATAVAAAGERSSGSSSCSNGASRVLVWAVGHSSSGVPAEWAAGARRPGVFMTDLSPRDVGQLGDMVRAEKRPKLDVAVVSVHWGPNWGYDVPRQHQRFARMLIDHAGVDCVHGHSSHHAMGCELYRGKLIMYGAGDLISDYEGIQNPYIQAEYPPHLYRDDVGLLWYADLDSEDGTLRELNMVPTRLRHLRLEAPQPDDWRYVETMMDRECRKLGIAAGVRRVRAAEGDALHLQFLAGSSTVVQ